MGESPLRSQSTPRPGRAERREARPRVTQRRSLFPNTVVLLLAITALLLFIGVMGDARRVRNALHQADIYAASYTERAAHTKVLPLNLEPESLGAADLKLVDFESITTEQVIALRHTGEPVMVAWSEPVRKFFGQDGQAAILFRAGEFEVQWLTADQFQLAQAAQAELIRRIQAQIE